MVEMCEDGDLLRNALYLSERFVEEYNTQNIGN